MEYDSAEDSDYEEQSQAGGSADEITPADGSQSDENLDSDVDLDESEEEPDDDALEAAAAAAQKSKPHPMTADFEGGRIIMLSIDMETGGENCGPVQLSGKAYDPHSNKMLGESFNMYIKPPANAVWNPATTEVHGLHARHENIVSAEGDLATVWPQFIDWMESFLQNGAKKGCIIAWNGASCDMEWYFRITEIEQTGRAARWTPFFWDPLKTIRGYKTCPLHMKQSMVNSYSCEDIWMYVMLQKTGVVHTELPGAHDSLVDADAQLTIVMWLREQKSRGDSWLNKRKGPQLVTDVYRVKRERILKQASVYAVYMHCMNMLH